MRKYVMTRKALLAAVLAIILGFISARFLPQGNPFVTVPWGIAAFVFAFFAVNRREAVLLGGAVGFIASYAYLWFDHSGSLSLSQFVALVLIIILPSLFGLVCGAVCALLGWIIRRKVFKFRTTPAS